MRSQLKRRRWSWYCLVAAVALAVALAPSQTEAAGKPGSGDFTIKAEYDGSSNSSTYTATGAIQDNGWYAVTDADRYVDENGEVWTRFRFGSPQGIFYVGWLPPDYEEGVEYPVELMPGTGAYADVSGIGTLKLRVRAVYGWLPIGWGGERVKWLLYFVEHVTVKGTLLP
jgi:hypothetical protein